MKKMIMAMMAAAMMATTGTALAATPEIVDCRENTPVIETNYAHCGGGYYGGGRGYGGGGGYCWGNGNNEG
ncbi:MAG: hypothetical protein IJT82_02620 [Schwartzia sp.]|nr:hypothetical protein [Schwartzia sp. (in: firmicutes)]